MLNAEETSICRNTTNLKSACQFEPREADR